MNNEPIAYIPDTGLKTLQDGSWCVANADKMGDSDIPLYTHPVNPYQSITNTKIEPTVVSYTHPVKELTDEEMLEIYKKVFNKKNEFKENLKRRSYFDFARAILRKASEK